MKYSMRETGWQVINRMGRRFAKKALTIACCPHIITYDNYMR